MTPKLNPTAKFGTISAAAVAAMAAAALACPGVARADNSPRVTPSSVTIVPAGETGTFKLTAVTRSAIVSAIAGRQLQICNKTGSTSALDEASAMPPFIPSGSSTLEVSYNGRTAQVMPGECYRTNAERVRITTREPLGLNGHLQGTVAWVAPARPVG
ncbi:MAG: hypothetical protein ACREUT_13345 [Steroidobacteraceae bacterium]